MLTLLTGALRAFQFESFRLPGVDHAIFTRDGGVSPEPWRSLNVGGSVGDDPERVATNRRRMFDAVGRAGNTLASVWQVHSDRVVVVRRPTDVVQPEKADAMVTDRSDVTLMMRFADCVPIFAFDPQRCAIGMAHAGWKGTLSGVASRLVDTLQREYGSRPRDLVVGIGPSIAAHHYPVGPEVVSAVRSAFGESSDQVLDTSGDDVCFDLWSANRLLLERAGVVKIEVSGLCTACQTEDWYSHRAQAGRTGRFGALMNLSR